MTINYKPGDLVRHRRHRTLHLISEVVEIKGRLEFVHLYGSHRQLVFYPDALELVNEAW